MKSDINVFTERERQRESLCIHKLSSHEQRNVKMFDYDLIHDINTVRNAICHILVELCRVTFASRVVGRSGCILKSCNRIFIFYNQNYFLL